MRNGKRASTNSKKRMMIEREIMIMMMMKMFVMMIVKMIRITLRMLRMMKPRLVRNQISTNL